MKMNSKDKCMGTFGNRVAAVGTSAQSRRDKEQTYVLEQPYEVTKITPPQGKKVKNVILMIGDGMSLMHVYSAWTANRGKLFLDNCQAVGLSKTYCADQADYGLRCRRNGDCHRTKDQLPLCGSGYGRTTFEISD